MLARAGRGRAAGRSAARCTSASASSRAGKVARAAAASGTVAEVGLELVQRAGRGQAERADPGPPQRRQVAADAERRAEVAGERPDVRARADVDLDVQVEAAVAGQVGRRAGQQVEPVHGHRPRGQLDLLAGPDPRVRAPAVDLDRADRARPLLDRRRSGAAIAVGHVGAGAAPEASAVDDDVALGVVGDGALRRAGWSRV